MFIPTETGHWVNEDFDRLARMVQDYDPAYELRWIPPEHRATVEERQKPYVVWDTNVNQPLFYVSELDEPTSVIERMFFGDQTKGNVLERIDAHNAAVKAWEMKKKMDLAEERQDYAAYLMGTKKNYLRLKDGTKVDDQLRPIL